MRLTTGTKVKVKGKINYGYDEYEIDKEALVVDDHGNGKVSILLDEFDDDKNVLITVKKKIIA